ncbi:hypothetical protein [Bacillus sp. AR18-7]|uniref:hypothetical protein n=1 Tax=Bacillus sp. AR18-7 TaxID=2217821 RepID=UPI0011CADF61|nr:hypothetical protein [Bacillus sp. AR18-7]TXR58960.1 hypothetical protein DN395_26080 [Bacillus sp. AR18-7]
MLKKLTAGLLAASLLFSVSGKAFAWEDVGTETKKEKRIVAENCWHYPNDGDPKRLLKMYEIYEVTYQIKRHSNGKITKSKIGEKRVDSGWEVGGRCK